MSEANIKTVQEIYEAFGRGDVAAIQERVTDDVDWASEAAATAGATWHGVHKGKAALPRFFELLGSEVEVTEFTPLAFADNDDSVMTVIRFGMKSRATGKQGEMDLHHWFQFRDGKVCRYRGTEDTALTQQLLNP